MQEKEYHAIHIVPDKEDTGTHLISAGKRDNSNVAVVVRAYQEMVRVACKTAKNVLESSRRR